MSRKRVQRATPPKTRTKVWAWRAATGGIAIASVAALATHCDVDGGLLDRNSTLSVEQTKSKRDQAHAREHAHDIHTDVIEFVGGICTSIADVQKAAESGSQSDDPVAADVAYQEARDLYDAIELIASDAANALSDKEPPTRDDVLQAGLPDNYWVDLKTDALEAFRTLANGMDSAETALDAGYASDPSGAITDGHKSAEKHLKTFGTTTETLIGGVKIPNQETLDEMNRRGVCAPASTTPDL